MTTLTINKRQYELDLKGHETLLEVLRDSLSLTGTKTGCEETECGTCTVLIKAAECVFIDGRVVMAEFLS